MTLNNRRILFYTLVLLTVLSFACNMGDDTDKANKLVDEGNTQVESGKQQAEQGIAKYQEAFNFEETTGSDADWAEAKQPAREAADMLEKAAASFTGAADKFAEAGKLKVDEKFKQYLDLKSQSFRKRAEQLRVIRSIAELLFNESIKSGADMLPKINEANERSQKLSTESEQLETQAEKIRQENAGMFQNDKK